MGHIETVIYTHVDAAPGVTRTGPEHKLVIYALSTCGFCERSMNFLRDQGLAFDYIFIDQLEPWIKTALKEELKERYGAATVFPYLVIDDKTTIVGFTEEKWRNGLGL
jgi:glutaredoxin